MNTNVNLSLFLDTRRPKKNGKYPVKLRLFHNKTQHLYKIGIDCTESDFFGAIESKKPRKELSELRTQLQAVEIKGKSIIEKMDYFNQIQFEKKMFLTVMGEKDVFHYYHLYEQNLKNDGKLNTADSYRLSRQSLKRFNESINIKSDKLPFENVDPEYLKKYERWMLSQNCGLTTVGIYLRPLRAIFNLAISEKEISMDCYPFGKRLYQIPAGQNIKKALTKEDLGKLFSYKTESQFQEKARAFWFFSYNCNGMNVKDIISLKFKNIEDNKINFYRSKTINTNRTKQKAIVVFINPYMEDVIMQYANKDQSPENYVFPVLNDSMSNLEKLSATRGFTKYINQHIKKLAKSAGVTDNISTYWARHSFTTTAIRSGNSLEMLQEALGHTDMKTTLNYWGGFEDKAKKELSEKLMDF